MNRSLVRMGLVVLIVGALAAPAPDDKGSDKPKGDAEALKGQWLMTKATVNGAPNSRQAGRVRYFFDNTSSFIISNDYVVTVEGDFTIDSTKSPKTIDLVSGSRETPSHWSGIYELDGDTLKVCLYLNNAARRPKTFESKRGSGECLYVFKRVKD
jgi:uncharacterized protein (TIGR03067 family)